jgi:hypothetical protein
MRPPKSAQYAPEITKTIQTNIGELKGENKFCGKKNSHSYEVAVFVIIEASLQYLMQPWHYTRM